MEVYLVSDSLSISPTNGWIWGIFSTYKNAEKCFNDVISKNEYSGDNYLLTIIKMKLDSKSKGDIKVVKKIDLILK